MKHKILVVVHPGSLCGSANMNLGTFEARSVRDEIAHELRTWDGGVVVLDGELSDELPEYPSLDKSLADALSRNSSIGVTARLIAGDPDHAQIALAHLEFCGVDKGSEITLTGAWFDPTWESGCVNFTHSVLEQGGYTNLTISETVADFGQSLDNEFEEEAGLDSPSSNYRP